MKSVPSPYPEFEIAELQRENQTLRQQLQQILEQAHRNQNIMERHQRFELDAIACTKFEELIAHIFSALAQTSELEMVTLMLLDPRQELAAMLADQRVELQAYPHLKLIANQRELASSDLSAHKPVLGPYMSTRHDHLFRSWAVRPRSVAVIPLRRQQKLIGFLNLGSQHAERFQRSMETDFIERLGSVIAIALENVLNNEKLVYIGLTDPLTKISNRRYVEQRMLEEINRARRQQYSIACMFLDIDFFKRINDQFGHQGGDDVLCEVAARIKAELRLSDTLGRFGGEEFVALLINTRLEDALQVAERIRRSIAGAACRLSDGSRCQTSISIGLTIMDPLLHRGEVGTVAREMLSRADQALYGAKHHGRNQVCYQ